jgi:hypothetical protein
VRHTPVKFAQRLFAPLFSLALFAALASAQPESFRIGERITYTVAFEKFSNVAYAEIHTVSRGKIGDITAVELRSRFKTLNFVSAAFYLVDESRMVFASPDTGLPLYISRTLNTGGLPKESIQNYLAAPTANYDLLTLIYKVRQSGGNGSVLVQDGERSSSAVFQAGGNEKVKTDLGEYDTTLVNVQCECFNEMGIRDVRVNLSTDEARLPVLIRFRTSKGEFRARAASVQNTEPAVAEVDPTPTPIKPVKPVVIPSPTPRPYVENGPLAPELSFALGETLEYLVTTNGQAAGKFVLQARERRLFQNQDSLLLTATVTSAEPGNNVFDLNDQVRVYVDPETLGPRHAEISFTGLLSSFNQTAVFDSKTSTINFNGGTGKADAPVGTHSILSLIYALRSFNLKPSRDTANPINDTRVAVFWDDKPYVFTLRPANAETITLQGEKISAQPVTITTNNSKLDALRPRLWLSNDERRVPLRFILGSFQADLISEKIVPPPSARP